MNGIVGAGLAPAHMARPRLRTSGGATTAAEATNGPYALRVEDLSVYYGKFRAVKDVSLDIESRRITALIGPSGCGKSTLLRCFNRMNDLIPTARVEGNVEFRGKNLYAPDVDAVEVRRRVGMVFQKPNPFPKSIYENIAWGAKINGFKGKMENSAEEIILAEQKPMGDAEVGIGAQADLDGRVRVDPLCVR